MSRFNVFIMMMGLTMLTTVASAQDDITSDLKIGVIGLDSSHATEFTRMLNDKDAKDHVPGGRVVAAVQRGSADIESSVSRIPKYTETVQKLGVEIVETIPELLERVDVVLLETNDGRPHLEQARLVIAAGKPCFIDKPVADSLADAVLIYREAAAAKVPVFSSSSLRMTPGALAARNGSVGEVLGCETYSPEKIEPTHPDLFWYGIHGVETLFTIMGPGCEQVIRIGSANEDVVVGRWANDRIGTFRGLKNGKTGYGGTIYGTKAIEQVGPFAGYRPLLVEIMTFFRTGVAPVSPRETLEIYAFMEAADESLRQGGAPVSIAETLKKAGAKENEFRD
jgi:predicted dehydrogenase